MKKILSIISILFSVFLLMAGSSFADSLTTDLGTNITVADGVTNSTSSQAIGAGSEDNETEIGTISNQAWDLEAIYWNTTTDNLYIIGGFDFTSILLNEYIGDLFIGSDYVLDLSRDSDNSLSSSGSYNLIQNYTSTTPADDISASSPATYKSGGSITANDGSYSSYEITNWSEIDIANGWVGYYTSGYTQSGSTNDTHYVLAISVSDSVGSLIDSGKLIHLTLSCGNDLISGQADAAPVPEPATMLLFGSGLVSLAGFGRRKFLKRG